METVQRCGRFLFLCSTLIIARSCASLQELESIFITKSTRHDETWLHPSHKDAPISPLQQLRSLAAKEEHSPRYGDTQLQQ
jgi:hypothetical protein